VLKKPHLFDVHHKVLLMCLICHLNLNCMGWDADGAGGDRYPEKRAKAAYKVGGSCVPYQMP